MNVNHESYRFTLPHSTKTICDVDLLEGIETGQDTGASDSSKDVGSGTLHHGHKALVLHDLNGAVDGALVLDAATGGHHHPPPDGVWRASVSREFYKD